MKEYRLRLEGARLTRRQTACLALYYFDNLTLDEIAGDLRIHRTVVSQHLRYGKRKLSAAGMVPRRLERAERPKLLLLSLEDLDELPAGSSRAQW